MTTYQGYIEFSFEFEADLNEQEAWERVVSLLGKDLDVYTEIHDGEIWVED